MITSEPILFLYCVISTTTMTNVPQLILDKTCLQTTGNETMCKDLTNMPLSLESSIQKESSKWVMYLFLCTTVPSSLSVITGGLIAKVYGIKQVLVFVPVLSCIQNMIFLMSSVYLETPNYFLLLGGLCVSLFGDIQGVMSLSYSHVAHITTKIKEQRTARMAILESCLFLAPAVAGISTGYLASYSGYWSVFLFSICCDFLLIIYIVFVFKDADTNYEGYAPLLPETQNTVNAESSVRTLNPFLFIKDAFRHVAEDGQHTRLFLLLTVLSLVVTGMWGEIYTVTLYLKNTPFHATAEEIGYFISLPGIIRGLSVVVLTQLSDKWLHLSDYTLVTIGIFSHIITFISFGLARSMTIIFICSSFSLFIPVAMTTLRSMMTKLVSREHNNAMVSVCVSLDVFSSILMSFVGLSIYYFTLETYSGIIFFIISGLDVLALIMLALSSRF